MAKSELTIEERVEQLEKKLNDAEAKLRRYSENWKNFCKIHLGSIAKDGKLGYTNVKLLGVLGMIAATVCIGTWLVADLAPAVTDRDNWIKAAIRADGRIDTEGAIIAQGNITSSGTVTAVTIIGNALTATNAADIMDAARYIVATNQANVFDATRYTTATNTADVLDAARYINATNDAAGRDTTVSNVFSLYVPLITLTNAIPPLTTNDCVASLTGPTNRVVFNVYGIKISSTQL